MTRTSTCKRRRRGMSMLELIIASTMTVTLMTSIGVVLRTSRAAWEAHEADFAVLEAGHATMRHMVRRIRRAQEVAAISNSNDNSGTISLRMADDSVWVWDHDSSNNQINFGLGSADDILSEDIDALTLTAYESDGATETTTLDDIRSVHVEIQITLPGQANSQRTLSSWIWIRAW